MIVTSSSPVQDACCTANLNYTNPTGTETNNELCSHIPGPACSAVDSRNEEDGPGEGFIHVHRGFHGVGETLSEAGYDWRNPVAEVFISPQ